MSAENKIIFQRIDPLCHSLESVIKDSIGFPTPEKITQVLKSYELPDHVLIGAFLSKSLIGVIGYVLNDKQATIKHLSVLENFRSRGVGKALIQTLVQDCTPNKILLETDGQSASFYKKLGFVCEFYEGEHGNRYHCCLDLSTSDLLSFYHIITHKF